MGSHAADQKTATAASQGAQAQDQQLAANAAKNQNFADSTRSNLFGSRGADGNYSGGTVSQFLNPAELSKGGLSGSYAENYNNEKNQVAQGTQHAVGTTMQDLANRGMGSSPAGFAADQERRAYQNQADTLGNLYAGAAGAQHGEALNNYWNATNMLNSNASQTANLSLQGNTAAANNYGNLYGTGEQQVQSGWGAALGALGGVAGSAAGGWAGGGFKKPGCWIAEAVYGEDDMRTHIVRAYLNGEFADTFPGNIIMAVYLKIGRQVAGVVKRSRILRAMFKPLFDIALGAALQKLVTVGGE